MRGSAWLRIGGIGGVILTPPGSTTGIAVNERTAGAYPFFSSVTM